MGPTPLTFRKESSIIVPEITKEEEEVLEKVEEKKQRKSSIPLLDSDRPVPEVSVSPHGSGPYDVAIVFTLQTASDGDRKISEVSTSSGWSFSSQGENEDSVRGPGTSLGLETAEERSRRLSKLPPAEVNDPKATKVDKFVMIPHPGK